MSLGIDDRDSRTVVILKLCVLIPLIPVTLLIGAFLHGVPEAWSAFRRFPEEMRMIYKRHFKQRSRP